MKQMLFILNPKAGMRKANRVLAEILDVFNRADYDVHVYVTAASQDGAEAVKRLAPGMDLVVCCGGDGTFNETITGLLDSKMPTDNSRSNMGIGLSVCRTIIKAHGSELKAGNRPGGGSVFRFALEMEETDSVE